MTLNVEHMLNLERLSMPSMPRLKGKPTKIAYSILGIPANMLFKKTGAQKKIDKRLVFEETFRVR